MNRDKLFVLGIIPARGGSKGIPGKNIVQLGGKPLIAYTIEAASQSTLLSDVIVTTDSMEIADVAKKFGASVPFLRPEEFATDQAPTILAVQHAVSEYEKFYETRVGIIVLLQPTSPFRNTEDIDTALRIFLSDSENTNSLISCYVADRVHPRIMYRPANVGHVEPYLMEDEGVKSQRRQDFNPLLVRNGALYIASRRLIFDESTLIGKTPLVYTMPFLRSMNIDDRDDLELSRLLLLKNCHLQLK